MKRLLLATICLFGVVALLAPMPASSQGNIDWEELWVRMQPGTTNGPYGWMAGQRQYTGLAYDVWRDVLYIVNPAICTVGSVSYGCPKIHIWDANTGMIKTNVGRDPIGQGGQLPVPSDTVIGTSPGWPGGTYGSFSLGQFPLYKIDLDDEGRIFACNLVSPIYGICFPGPPPNCDPIYLMQGPFRVYRWDTPKSSPKRAYATLNLSFSGPGTLGNSEMTWTRWGDAFDVVGKRGWYTNPTTQQPELRDSVRILVSGGAFSGQSETNREVNVILTDSRETRPSNGFSGQMLDYRLGIKLVSSLEGIGSHGLAATGPEAVAQIWMDNNNRATTLNNQGQTSAPFPQTIPMTINHALSMDNITGTGPSGPLAFFTPYGSGKAFLVCCDGFPTDPSDPSATNYNTCARIMNVTELGKEKREDHFGNTPQLGSRTLSPNSGIYNYIADVDVKLEGDPEGNGYYVILFVLMSNNGIAAYKSRHTIVPVELSTLRAVLDNNQVNLSWQVTSESNNYGFKVERSFDLGKTWESVGFVPGRGTSNIPMEYSYSDPVTETHITLGSVKYRIRQLDTDGRFALSPVVDVYMDKTPTTIQLSQNYPNPFNPSTTISYQLTKPGFVTMKVFNSLGEELTTLVSEPKDSGVHFVTFSADNLSSGTYVYQLNVDGQILQKKMVVMK